MWTSPFSMNVGRMCTVIRLAWYRCFVHKNAIASFIRERQKRLHSRVCLVESVTLKTKQANTDGQKVYYAFSRRFRAVAEHKVRHAFQIVWLFQQFAVEKRLLQAMCKEFSRSARHLLIVLPSAGVFHWERDGVQEEELHRLSQSLLVSLNFQFIFKSEIRRVIVYIYIIGLDINRVNTFNSSYPFPRETLAHCWDVKHPEKKQTTATIIPSVPHTLIMAFKHTLRFKLQNPGHFQWHLSYLVDMCTQFLDFVVAVFCLFVCCFFLYEQAADECIWTVGITNTNSCY